jgi:hypothetical protein
MLATSQAIGNLKDFASKRLKILNTVKIKIQKLKTYNEVWSDLGLSIATTLGPIQSRRTVPLNFGFL